MKKETPFDNAFDFPELTKMSDQVFYRTYKSRKKKQKRNAPQLRSDEIGVPFSRSRASAQDITYKT